MLWWPEAAAILLAAAAAAPCLAQPAQPAPPAPSAAAAPVALAASAPGLTREQLDATARGLRDIPALNEQRVVKRLHLKDGEPRQRQPDAGTPDWLRWLTDFVRWFNDAGRWLVWLVLALAIAWLLLRLRRWFGGRVTGDPGQALQLPTQVRGLDIRPDTLPDDVGAAAWALWQRGEARAALSLLYRGALSQLVHGHGVPIRASSTEGDCLRLAEPRLAAAALAYLRVLVAVWAQAVYAARAPSAEQVQPLCEGFATLRPAGGER
jgi:Domain of unknown function (DUF4129)